MEFSNLCFGGLVRLVGIVGGDYSDTGGNPFEDIVCGGKGGRRLANSGGARVFAARVVVLNEVNPGRMMYNVGDSKMGQPAFI